MRVLLVVPAFNEEETLPAVLAALRGSHADMDVLVVDDASTDRTPDVVREGGGHVVSLPVNLGIGGAVKAGYKFASVHGYDVAVQFDADGQHDHRQLMSIIGPVERGEADMVIGSRFIRREGYQSEWARRLGINLFSWMTSAIIGQRVTDVTSGFRAVGRSLVERFARQYPVEFPDAEAIIIAARMGFKIREVPVTMTHRVSGRSFFSFRRKMVYPMKTMISILATALRSGRHYEAT